MILRVLLIVVLLLRVAHGGVVFQTGFEATDTGTTTAKDVFELVETDCGSSEDSDLAITTDRDHNNLNGGHVTGQRGVQVDLASGECRYYSLPSAVALASNDVTLAVALHLPSTPSGDWTFLEQRMGSGGVNRGCYARLNTSGTVSVYYATTGTLIGTSGTVLRAKTCSGDASRGCTVNSDCISPQTCVSCTASTSVGCHEPVIRLRQRNTFSGSGDLVTCDLYVNGTQEVAGTPTTAASLGIITDLRVGGPETESLARSAYFDDVVVGVSGLAGYGWVATATAAANGTVQWAAPNCDVATNWQCLNDWSVGGNYDSDGTDGTTRATAVNLTDSILLSAIAPGTASVDAVSYLVTGRTSADSGTYGYETALLTCPTSSSCVPTTAIVGSTGQATSHKLLAYDTSLAAPGPIPSWNATTLSQLGVRYKSTAIPNNANLRVGGVLAYAHGVLPDEPPPPNLRDHNLGTNDGIIACFEWGDSLCAATNQQTCQGGQDQGKSCAQESACDWSIAAGVGDRPVGGCTTNAECRTCTAQASRDASPNGAGYPCTDDTWCGNSQTCNLSTGTCSVNTNIPCSADAQCVGLGSCATTATCQDTCVGGTCPSITGWPGGMVGKQACDVIVACGLGNEPSWNLVGNRAPGMLYGNHATCLAIVGSGACGCDSDDDCGTSGHCDLPSGKCDAGDEQRVLCTAASTCASGFACRFPPPDYADILSSANDFNPGAGYGVVVGAIGFKSAANCREPGSLVYAYNDGEACDPGVALTPCTSDGDCSGISPTSTCVGVTRGNGDLPCVQQALAGLFSGGSCAGGVCDCSMQSYQCRSSADCPDGLSCSIETPEAPRWTGYCGCSNDSQCGNTSIWKCRSGKCARKGTSNETCSSPTRTGAYDATSGTCKGVCTMPCDRHTCTTDNDCVVKRYPNAIPGPATYRGECVAGRCANCGPEPCPRDASAAWAHANWAEPFLRYGMTYQFERLQQMIDQTPDVDGRPVIIPVTQPEYAKVMFCPISGGTGTPCARGERQVPLSDACAQFGLPDWGNGAYHAKRMKSRFRHVADLRACMAGNRCRNAPLTDACALHSDGVHFLPPGALGAGACIAAVKNAFNTCVLGETAQRYCREPDGDWVTTPNNGACTTSTDCAGGATCVVRPCLNASSTADDTSAGCPGAAVCNLE